MVRALDAYEEEAAVLDVAGKIILHNIAIVAISLL